jgi:hypothetical protein
MEEGALGCTEDTDEVDVGELKPGIDGTGTLRRTEAVTGELERKRLGAAEFDWGEVVGGREKDSIGQPSTARANVKRIHPPNKVDTNKLGILNF